MKTLLTKLLTFLLSVSLLLCLVACNSNNDEKTEPADTETQQQTETTSKPDDSTSQGDNTEKSLLSGTYKVARKDIYVDIPNFNAIEEGYTQIYLDGSSKYVAFTCHKAETAETIEDAHKKAFDCFKSGIDSHHHINDETNLQTTDTTINSIQTMKFEGTISSGRNPVYNAYAYGYSFVYDGMPCSIIGVVMDESQPDAEKQLVKQIVDEMMKTVRNSK